MCYVHQPPRGVWMHALQCILHPLRSVLVHFQHCCIQLAIKAKEVTSFQVCAGVCVWGGGREA